MIEAKIIKDSISLDGKRITTFELVYPRFIHSELMTHRVFSRNAASSRAIPVKRIIADIRSSVAMPVHWGKNQPGMQAKESHDAEVILNEWVEELEDFWDVSYTKEEAWCRAAEAAIKHAEAFLDAGYHKQIVNRILEPYVHMRTLVTATEFSNFFALRAHPDAQPEFQELAYKMLDAYERSAPQVIPFGGWHLPYVDQECFDLIHKYLTEIKNGDYTQGMVMDHALQVSVARCARVSYKDFDGETAPIEAELELFNKLVGSSPLHASPAEHQASPDRRLLNPLGEKSDLWSCPAQHGNFVGWLQYRKRLPNECQ